MTLDELIAARKEHVIRRFVLGVASASGTPPASRAQLTDEIPWFLDELVIALQRTARESRPSVHEERPAREHGKQRFALGFDLEGVVREYGILRDAILEFATEEDVRITTREFACFSKALHLGVQGAVHEYLSHSPPGAPDPAGHQPIA